MFGLGKKRTSFGKMLDKAGISQREMAKASGVKPTLISRMCNDDDYKPKFETDAKIKQGLKKLR